MQCTHPFTVLASLSRAGSLPCPPADNISLSATFFPLSSAHRPPMYLFYLLSSRAAAAATAVASDDGVSNGSGGHTILRLNSTDTAAQLRSFSSYSLSLSFSFSFSLSISLCPSRDQPFFLLPFFPVAHVQPIFLFYLFSFSLPDPLLSLSLSHTHTHTHTHTLFLLSARYASAIRPDTRPPRRCTFRVSIENVRDTYVACDLHSAMSRRPEGPAIEKSDCERAPSIFHRGNVLRVVGKGTKSMVTLRRRTRYLAGRGTPRMRTGCPCGKGDMETT